MKKYTILFALVFLGLITNAQQDPQFSQNVFNTLAVNPGYAGSNNAICATALHRSQWMGFDGGPKTMNLGVEAALPMLHGGMGLNILTDKVALNEFLGLNLSYAYQLEMAEGTLGIGLSLGMLQAGVSGDYNAEQTGDAAIPSNSQAAGFDFGAGLYYNSDKIDIGFSTTHLNEPIIEDYNTKRHYYLTAAYLHELNPALVLMPSVFIKNDGITTSYDLSTLLEYNNRFWSGVTYRPSEDAILLLGMSLNESLRFGVAYDIPISAVSTAGSIEFMVKYCFKIDYTKVVKGFKNPRIL